MNPKHLALNFNINAIIDKSEPERKTFLDKMVEAKANAQNFLDKHKDYLPQDRIEKLMEVLQVLNAKIEKVQKTLPLANLPKDCLLKLGDVFPVTHQVNGKTVESLGLLVTEAGVKSCGFDLAEIFKPCPGKKTWQTASTGHIVSMDLYQQLALAEAFVLKYPELKSNFGFYNLRGSKDVYGVLKDKVDTNTIYWFFTGETFNNREYDELGCDENKYEKSYRRPAAGLVTLSTVKKGIDSPPRFCHRSAGRGDWSYAAPAYSGQNGALVLGLIIE